MTEVPMFTRGVSDPFCADGHVITTSTDRRLLWHVEMAVSGMAGDRARELSRDLRHYLNATCEHHWHENPVCCEPPQPGCVPSHKQCLWCHDVVWAENPRETT